MPLRWWRLILPLLPAFFFHYVIFRHYAWLFTPYTLLIFFAYFIFACYWLPPAPSHYWLADTTTILPLPNERYHQHKRHYICYAHCFFCRCFIFRCHVSMLFRLRLVISAAAIYRTTVNNCWLRFIYALSPGYMFLRWLFLRCFFTPQLLLASPRSLFAAFSLRCCFSWLRRFHARFLPTLFMMLIFLRCHTTIE